MKTAFILLALTFVWAGCDRNNPQKPDSSANAQTVSQEPSEPESHPSVASQTATGEKTCFHCAGAGQVDCTTPGCVNGMTDCPGPCLKLSLGVWEHLDVNGHRPDELWRKFNNTDDNGWQAWNQDHVGEVIEMRDGKPFNAGKCHVCGGSGKVRCGVCIGTGQNTCPICDGKKVVPESWTEFNNPKLKNPPNAIRLKDGRTIIGKIEMRIGSRVTIRTGDGNQIEMDARDIVSTPAPR